MDFEQAIFTTLPVVSVPQKRNQDYTHLYFAHFANGSSFSSELVFVNVAARPIRPAVYFHDYGGKPIAPASVVDLGDRFQVRADGALTVRTAVAPLGELTISTHGRGDLVNGSVKVVADGPVGGFLRFDLPEIGVAGVGASQPVQDALFPARNRLGGIRTGVAIRNRGATAAEVTCRLLQGGMVLEEKLIPLMTNGQAALFVDELFDGPKRSDFVGSVRCTARDGEEIHGSGAGDGRSKPDLDDAADGSGPQMTCQRYRNVGVDRRLGVCVVEMIVARKRGIEARFSRFGGA